MNCKHCLGDIGTKPRTGIHELARRKGYCDWVCAEQANPVSESEIQSELIRTRIPQPGKPTRVPCYCAKCGINYHMELLPHEYKSLVLLPESLTPEGRIKMACDNCSPSVFSHG